MEAAALDEYIDEESKKDPLVVNLADIEALDISEEEDNKGEEDSAEIAREFIVDAIRSALAEALAEEKNKERELAGQPLNYILPGTCVSYKRYVYYVPGPDDDPLPEPSEDFTQYPLFHQPGAPGAEGPGVRIVGEHYCNLFDMECSARPGDATLPTCWRNIFARTVREELFDHEQILRMKRVQKGLVDLQNLLDHAKGYK
jgi:hypothetical protein